MQRQVPKYCIIGDGKAARHFSHYFHLSQIPFVQWSRAKQQRGNQLNLQDTLNLNSVDVVLLLISDDAIEDFYQKNSFLQKHLCVHFSGTLSSSDILGCHPLMTFSESLYELETYQKMAFIVEQRVDFRQIFPQLINPVHVIDDKNKVLYHSLCVMAGNFPQILWQAVSKQLQSRCDLPKTTLEPYLRQVTENFLENPQNSLTGPLQRGDENTVAAHLKELEGSDLAEIYQAFVNHYVIKNTSINTDANKDLNINIQREKP